LACSRSSVIVASVIPKEICVEHVASMAELKLSIISLFKNLYVRENLGEMTFSVKIILNLIRSNL
jgi:hypothetical protein